VFLIEPVSPRPLPEYDAAKEKQKERDRLRAERSKERDGPPPEGNIRLGSKAENTIKSAIKEDYSELVIHLLEGEIRDFKLKRVNLKSIEYFEDMLMAEADRLILVRDYPRAFEHLLLVQRRNPNWKGLSDRVNRLLFEEGSWAIAGGDKNRGARLLGELAARKPDYPGLNEKLALAYGGRIEQAITDGRFAEARSILHSLELIAPQNDLVAQSRSRFLDRAQRVVEKARAASGPERLDLWAEALRIWPALEGAPTEYESAFAEWPTLDVAVVDTPRNLGPWIRTPAARRVAPLLYAGLTDRPPDATAGAQPLLPPLVTNIEVQDLGRRLELTMRSGPMWSDGSRPTSAVDVARALVAWSEPRSPGYLARWADLLERVEVLDDTRVMLQLRRPLIRPEVWLERPIGPAHAAWDGRVAMPDGQRRPVGNALFAWSAEAPDRIVLERADNTSAPNPPRIRRLREIRYPNTSAALGAFLRGDVTLLDHVPPDRVSSLLNREDIRIGRYVTPGLHILAIDGRNPALRNRTLRRAIALAFDRKQLLEENVLRRPVDDRNHPADGIALAGSAMDAPGMRPHEANPVSARMLVAAARRELGGRPIRLTIEYPARAEAQAALPRIAESLRAAGLEIDLAERNESDLEERLTAGARFDLAYRVVRPTEPLRDIASALCPGYDAPGMTTGLSALESSPRILQLVLELEQASDQAIALEQAQLIDRESHDELPVIPLWQLDDHFAWRTRLVGPQEIAASLYQGIDTWEVLPWFARDPW
jgi:peptide/nickel transport system substrate-binding protein